MSAPLGSIAECMSGVLLGCCEDKTGCTDLTSGKRSSLMLISAAWIKIARLTAKFEWGWIERDIHR